MFMERVALSSKYKHGRKNRFRAVVKVVLKHREAPSRHQAMLWSLKSHFPLQQTFVILCKLATMPH